MGMIEGMNKEISALRRRVAQLENTSKEHGRSLNEIGDVLSEPASVVTPAMIPFVGHPIPGEKGWTTSQGKRIEILGFDEESGDVWCKFPTDPSNTQHKTYRYRAAHWEKYWKKYWVADPGRLMQFEESETTKIEIDLDDIAKRLRKEFRIQTEQAESLTDEPLSPRLETFMRMTLNALDQLMLHSMGHTSIVMTAFDPPLHHIPNGPRYIPPRDNGPEKINMDEFDDEEIEDDTDD